MRGYKALQGIEKASLRGNCGRFSEGIQVKNAQLSTISTLSTKKEKEAKRKKGGYYLSYRFLCEATGRPGRSRQGDSQQP